MVIVVKISDFYTLRIGLYVEGCW